MAHPKTKAELLAQTRAERDSLLARLTALSPEELLRRGDYGWSAKDHVAHLADWERLLFGWHETWLRGETPALPAEGYTWRTIDALNQAMFERHHDDSIEAVMSDWRATSERLIRLIEGLSEEDLFARDRFAWARGPVASYVYECGANHYRWSAGEIAKGLNAGEQGGTRTRRRRSRSYG